MSTGLIPAHAGKTRRESRRPTGSRAHPRSRGENLPDEIATCQAGGSSPLTRGKPLVRVSNQVSDGLIPAHAGKTHPERTHHAPYRAHPRSRGENALKTSS